MLAALEQRVAIVGAVMTPGDVERLLWVGLDIWVIDM
jgi:hypothetical protein